MLPSDRPQAGAAIQGPAVGLHSLACPVCRSVGVPAPWWRSPPFQMAHYPRWGGSNVDSSAMLSAYLDWTHRATEQELQATVPHLWLVEHRAPGRAQPIRVRGITIPSRLCATLACNRCTQLWGGYKFRWIDARWLDEYETMRRPGSWSSVQVERLRT